jgi:hypothetical protein
MTTVTDDFALSPAVTAAAAFLRYGPDTTPETIAALHKRACETVTRAVADGHSHSLIASKVGCSGLEIADLILNWSAQAQALRDEREKAELYLNEVKAAARTHVVRRQGIQGYGAVEQASRELGVSRGSAQRWIARARSRPHAEERANRGFLPGETAPLITAGITEPPRKDPR